MRLPAGTHTFGPENGALWVKTRRTGAAAAAGHDLVILVTGWTATLEVGADPAETTVIALDVDATSLRVREGVGGMQELGDDDKESIRQTIDDEVLQGSEIRFRSTGVEPLADGDRLWVEGDLTLAGAVRPLAFDIEIGDDGRLSGIAVVKQSDWGMTPYTTLYGALKVVDEVEVAVSVSLGAGAPGDAEAPEPSIPWDLSWQAGPLVDPRISSGIWAFVFFVYLWLGGAAVGLSLVMSLVLALLAAGAIFVFVRRQGVGREDQSL